MYIETSYRVSGDNAKLKLSVSGNRELSCLTFYYHMYGNSMGSLTVFSGNARVFRTSGNRGNYWLKAERTIYLANSVSYKRTIFRNLLIYVSNVINTMSLFAQFKKCGKPYCTQGTSHAFIVFH